jgi:CheY-like chemotaxis protein
MSRLGRPLVTTVLSACDRCGRLYDSGNTAHLHGYEVVRRLRESDDFAVTRIIAISGYDTPEARDRAVEAGFDHHLSKPVPLKDLEKLLSAYALRLASAVTGRPLTTVG